MVLDALWDWIFTDRGQSLVAGALGGLVRWVTIKEKKGAGFTSVLVGAICGVYLNPIVKPMLTPVLGGWVAEEGSRSSFSAFIIGMGGIFVSGFFVDFWKARQRNVSQEPKA